MEIIGEEEDTAHLGHKDTQNPRSNIRNYFIEIQTVDLGFVMSCLGHNNLYFFNSLSFTFLFF